MTKISQTIFRNLMNDLAAQARGCIERLAVKAVREHSMLPRELTLSVIYDPQGHGSTWRVEHDPYVTDGMQLSGFTVQATVSADDLRVVVAEHAGQLMAKNEIVVAEASS